MYFLNRVIFGIFFFLFYYYFQILILRGPVDSNHFNWICSMGRTWTTDLRIYFTMLFLHPFTLPLSYHRVWFTVYSVFSPAHTPCLSEPLFRTIFHLCLHYSVGILSRGDRTRTCDIMVPNHVRYQLRHTPIIIFKEHLHFIKNRAKLFCWSGRTRTSNAIRQRFHLEIYHCC